MNSFIRAILIICLVYYLIKFALRLLAPFLIRQVGKKMEQQFRNQFDQFNQQGQSFNQEINYQNNSKQSNPKPKKQVGDYVDFEEVE